MGQFDFTLRFMLPEGPLNMESLAERLYEGGCDDALVGIGNSNTVALDFSREGADAVSAMESAVADVLRVVPAAMLIETGPTD